MIPEAWAPTLGQSFRWRVQTVAANGDPGAPVFAGFNRAVPFFDGRAQLRQNLKFMLRAADLWGPFACKGDPWWLPQALIRTPTNYAYAGFSAGQEWGDEFIQQASYPGELIPFYLNHVLRNLVFDATELDAVGFPTTGFDWHNLDVALYSPFLHVFSMPNAATNLPAVLGTTTARWLFPYNSDWLPDGSSPIGISWDLNTGLLSVDPAARNWFGLPWTSAKIAASSSHRQSRAGATGAGLTMFRARLAESTLLLVIPNFSSPAASTAHFWAVAVEANSRDSSSQR
jgi:hypothetical protein